MEVIIILLRFLIIFALALIFGLERQRSHQPVGFGTFVFVSVGACGLTMAALILNPEDPLPVIGAIITGIGFLGAGALIKTTDKIFGFTSAAGIWLFAILGVVTGLGEYLLAISMYMLIWATLFIDKFLQKKGIGSYQKKLSIITNKNMHTGELASMMEIKDYQIQNINIDKKSKRYYITLLVRGTKENINRIPKVLTKLKIVESFKIE